jgi:hypothetical protein
MSRQYHGTNANLKPGDLITPGRSNIRGRAKDSGGYVHSTPYLAAARAFAWFKGGRNVYEVQHTGPTQRDPNAPRSDRTDADYGAIRSRKPMRVVGKVQGGAPRGRGGYSWRGPAFGGGKDAAPKSKGHSWKGPAFK